MNIFIYKFKHMKTNPPMTFCRNKIVTFNTIKI